MSLCRCNSKSIIDDNYNAHRLEDRFPSTKPNPAKREEWFKALSKDITEWVLWNREQVQNKLKKENNK